VGGVEFIIGTSRQWKVYNPCIITDIIPWKSFSVSQRNILFQKTSVADPAFALKPVVKMTTSYMTVLLVPLTGCAT